VAGCPLKGSSLPSNPEDPDNVVVVPASGGWRAVRLQPGTTDGGDDVTLAACLEMVAWEFTREGYAPIPMTSEGRGVFLHRETRVCSTSMKDAAELRLGCRRARTALLTAPTPRGDAAS